MSYFKEEPLACLDNYVKLARINEQTFIDTKKRVFNTGDKYIDNVNLFHNINRRYEGFIFLIEDYFLGEKSLTSDVHNLKANPNWGFEEYMYLIYTHRIFGSGTSNAKNHGYHNSILTKISHLDTYKEIDEFIENDNGNFVSCAVNQPPRYPLKKLVREHFRPWLNYILTNLKGRVTPLDIINTSNDYNLKNNLHRFNFHYLLMAGDIANYVNMESPIKGMFDVDEGGMCSFGPTAVGAMKLLRDKHKYDDFLLLCDRYDTKPIDLEDLLCVWFKYIHNPIWSFYIKPHHEMSDFENGWDICTKHKSYFKFKEQFNSKQRNLFS